MAEPTPNVLDNEDIKAFMAELSKREAKFAKQDEIDDLRKKVESDPDIAKIIELSKDTFVGMAEDAAKRVLATAPIGQEKQPLPLIDLGFVDGEDPNGTYKGIVRHHALAYAEFNVDTNNPGSIGGREMNTETWTAETEMNPWRGYISVVPVNGSTVTVPKNSGMAFTKRGTVPAMTARTFGGAVSEETVTIDTYDGQLEYSRPSIDDIPGLMAAVDVDIRQQADATEATAITATLKAEAGTGEVTTGVAAALPTAANTPGKLRDMIAALPAQHRPTARFQMAREVEALLTGGASTSSGYAFDPQIMLNRFYGFPVVINGYLDAGGTANDVSCWLGNFREIFFYDRQSLTTESSTTVKLGSLVIYAFMRFKEYIRNEAALVKLTTKV